MKPTRTKLIVEGSQRSGYWVNLAPGTLRLGPVCPTQEAACRQLEFYRRLYRAEAPTHPHNVCA